MFFLCNHKERSYPAEDAELDEMIFHKTFRGGTAEAIDDHVLKGRPVLNR